MKTFNYVPDVCKGDDAKWQGSVLLRMPTFDEKCEMIESLDFKTGEDSVKANIALTRQLVKMSERFYVTVDLSSKDGLSSAKSYQDMQDDHELHGALVAVGSLIFEKINLGNG